MYGGLAAGQMAYPPRPPSQADEEITTIFVVGFPDDMSEREFQNMFIFSPGFEAATLKIPTGEDETTGRKQIIGFAKFRSRLEALEARDILTGRKVDAEKGCILKAEMAKKNLHTKRGLSVDYSSNNTYSYQTHFQHYNRRFTSGAGSAGSMSEVRSERLSGSDLSSIGSLGRSHSVTLYDVYPTNAAVPPDLPLHGQSHNYMADAALRSVERSPYLLEKDLPGGMGMTRSGSRPDSVDDLRDDVHADLLMSGAKSASDRLYADRFSYSIVPASLPPHHHHQHTISHGQHHHQQHQQHTPPSGLLVNSLSSQSLVTNDDYGLLPRLTSSQSFGPGLTSPPASTIPSGVSSPYMRTALNSYTSEEDLKTLFGPSTPGLSLHPQR